MAWPVDGPPPTLLGDAPWGTGAGSGTTGGSTPPSTPPGTPPGTPGTPPLPGTLGDANAILSDSLNQFGLGSLTSWAWGLWQQGYDLPTIYALLRQQPAYQARFPAMATLAARGQAITEGDYINYERTIGQIQSQYGIQAGTYDTPADIADLLTKNVSAAEYSARLGAYREVAYSQDPNTLDALQRLYGITPDHLVGYFVDPAKGLPALQQQAAATVTAAQAQTVGLGQLSLGQAERYAGANQADLATAAGLLPLLKPLVGTSEQGVTEDTLLSGVLDRNAASTAELRRREASRISPFAGGGGFAQNSAIGAAV